MPLDERGLSLVELAVQVVGDSAASLPTAEWDAPQGGPPLGARGQAADANWTAATWLIGLGLLAGSVGVAAFGRRDLVGA
jgi:hypothetical protein